MSFQWEEDLRQSFLRHASPEIWCSSPKAGPTLTAIESTCSDGRADWVWATLAHSIPDDLRGIGLELMQQPACSRILAALKRQRNQPDDRLQFVSGVSRNTYRRHLATLRESGLILEKGRGIWSLGKSFRLPDNEICSFEFKLYNWKRALQQAQRYLSFSHRVYVVMPEGETTTAMRHTEWFRRHNVGLIEHNPSGRSRRLILSKKRTPRCPSEHIQAIGFLESQVVGIPAS